MQRTCGACGAERAFTTFADARDGACASCGKALAPLNAPVELDDAALLDDVKNSSIPVLLDFWTEWCGPCLALEPAVERVARDLAGRVIVVKVDVVRYWAIAARYGVDEVPHLTLLKDGALIRETGRVVAASTLRRWVVEAARA